MTGEAQNWGRGDSLKGGKRGAASACLAPPAGEAPEEKECPVCRNPFDAERCPPRLLECLHTFCLPCLTRLSQRAAGAGSDTAEQGAAITCPLCRHRTILPNGSPHILPVNIRLAKPMQLQPLLPLPAPAHGHPLLQQSGLGATLAAAIDAGESLGARGRHKPLSATGNTTCVFLFVALLSGVGVILLSVLKVDRGGMHSLLFIFLLLICVMASLVTISNFIMRADRSVVRRHTQ